VLTEITGSTSLHQASSSLMFYVVECLRPTIYGWCTSLLGNMKRQLTECKLGRKRNFWFSSILCIFFFERVLGLGPIFEILPRGPHDPAIVRWTRVMRCKGGGRVPTPVIHNFGRHDDVLIMVYSSSSLELSPEKSYLYLFPEITVLRKVRRLPIHLPARMHDSRRLP
jgi:hypothetical protein